MTNAGHHDSSTHLHLSYKIHSSKDFTCSMKFMTEKHWCPVSTFSYFHGKAFLGKPATITFGEKKECVMDQIQTVVWQFFCASLGRSLCHGNKHHGIDPNMSNSGHDCSRKPVFPLQCQTAILPRVGTSVCWLQKLQYVDTWHFIFNLPLSFGQCVPGWRSCRIQGRSA